jgi:hypothetical protein
VLYFNPAVYILPPSIAALETQITKLIGPLRDNLPDRFDDWEDDDFHFDDQEFASEEMFG